MDSTKDTPDQKRGLYHKYNVTKAESGELVQNCIVLRPDRDRAALWALWDYASYITPEYPQFAHELGEWLVSMEKQLSGNGAQS